MELENRKSHFIRDLVVRILLIVLFIFLLMYLFPMPNLNAFYDRVFNDNIQTMKDAAKDYYTIDRMPKEVGDTSELTLQEMIDNKLVLPFVDKDGNSCDTNSSYVQVKKNKKEYVMKISLTCGNDTDYIIEHIGCYNFCTEEKCTQVLETQTPAIQNTVTPSVKPSNNVTTPSKTPVNYTPTPSTPNKPSTPSNPDKPSNPDTPDKPDKPDIPDKPSTPDPVYKTLYEYSRAKSTETWTLLDWQNTAMTETDDLKLVDTKIEYTGQKKITTGTTLYKHIKYAYKDNWTEDTTWTEEVKQVTDNVKLYASRTLYTGQKEIVTKGTKYRHVRTKVSNNWTTTDWTSAVKATSANVKLVGTRYKVSKTKQNTNSQTVTTTKTVWGDWKRDYTWRTSKPADTSTKQWGSVWDSKTTGSTSSVTSRVKIYDDYKSTTALSNNSTYTYVFLRSSDEPCTSYCNGKEKIKIYHYMVYKNVTTTTAGTKQYRYNYREKKTVTENTTVDNLGNQTTDTKWVTSKADLQKYISNGYMLVETQYKYKINNSTSATDYIWTDSEKSPAGYTYTGQSTVQTVTKYENLEKWVTNTDKLGEYTHNVTKVNQYKYRYNNPTKYIEDTLWTESKTAPTGYTYTGQTKSNSQTSYADLGKWVSTKQELGEYKENVTSRKKYQYKKRTTSTYYETKWAEKSPGSDWKATGNSKTIEVK